MFCIGYINKKKDEDTRGSHAYQPPGMSGIWPHHLDQQGIDGCHTDEEAVCETENLQNYPGLVFASKKAFMPSEGGDRWAGRFATSIEKAREHIARTNRDAGGEALDPAFLTNLVTPPVTFVVNHDDERRLAELNAKPIGKCTIEEIEGYKKEIEELERKKRAQLKTKLVPPLLFNPFLRQRSGHNLNAENYWLLANTICELLSNERENIKPVKSYENLSANLEEFRESFNADKIIRLLKAMEEQYASHESDGLKENMRESVRLFLEFLANCPFLCLYNINNGVDVRLLLSKLVKLPYASKENKSSFAIFHNYIVEQKISYVELLQTREFRSLVRHYNECDPTAFDALDADRIEICKAISGWLKESEFGAGSYSKEDEAKICDGFVGNAESIMPWYKKYAEKFIITPQSVSAEEQTTEASATSAQE